jgi:hypothetical protein
LREKFQPPVRFTHQKHKPSRSANVKANAAGMSMIAAADIARARCVPIERIIDGRGIKLRGRIERVGPCPVCGGTDRFSVNVKKRVFNCRRCQVGGDVIALIQHLDDADFSTAVETIIGPVGAKARYVTRPPQKQTNEDYECQQHRKALWLWQSRKPITGTVAEKYLRDARGYQRAIPAALAYLPPTKPGHQPAIIAAFGVPGHADVGAVHLTLLKPDGNDKADVQPNKIIVGSPRGQPIVLAPPNDLLGLAITEGVEDGLTARAATGLGVWAAGAAGFMPALADAVPEYIEVVTVFSHADQSGQKGAAALAEKLYARGFEVRIEGAA